MRNSAVDSCWTRAWGKDHARSIPDGKAACETCHAVWNWVATVLVAVVSAHVASFPPGVPGASKTSSRMYKRKQVWRRSPTQPGMTPLVRGLRSGPPFPDTQAGNGEVMRFWGHEEAPWVPQLVCYKWGIKRGAKPFCVCISWILKGVLLGCLDQTVNLRHSQIYPLWCGESMWIKHNQTSKFKGCETCSKVENGDCSCCTFP